MGRLLVIVGLIAAIGCGDGGDQRPSTGPAGKVVAVSGEVTAERGDPPASRALAVGDVVHAEDVVITAPEASVSIALDHNRALWTLEGGERRAVRESAAWTAPEQQGGSLLAGEQDDRTTAAGRHAEREAAETRASAPELTAEPAAPGAALMADESADEPEPPALPPPPPVKSKRRVESRSKGDEPIGDIGTLGRGGGAGTGSGYGSGGGSPGEGKQAIAVELAGLEVEGYLDSEIVRRILRQRMGQLRYCYEKQLQSAPDAGGTLRFAIQVAATGKVTGAKLQAGSDASLSGTAECVQNVWTRLQFPESTDESVSVVTVRLTFRTAK